MTDGPEDRAAEFRAVLARAPQGRETTIVECPYHRHSFYIFEERTGCPRCGHGRRTFWTSLRRLFRV